MLALKDVTHGAARQRVLDRVSWEITPDASPVGVLGLSSVARAQLMDALTGRRKIESGSMLWSGPRDRRGRPAIHRLSGVGHPATSRSVATTLDRLAARRPPSNIDVPGTSSLLEAFGLAARGQRPTKELSRAERIRMEMAVAAASGAGLVLLDAPAEGLAGPDRDSFLADLQGLLAALSGLGVCPVYLAAQPDEIETAVRTILIFAAGRLIQAGEAAAVFERPLSLEAAQRTSRPSLNLLPLTLSDGAARLPDGSLFAEMLPLPLPRTGRCVLALRPRDIRFERNHPDWLRVPGRLLGPASVPGVSHVRMDVAGIEWLAPAPSSDGGIAPGRVLNLYVDRARLMAFDDAGRALFDAPEALLFDRDAGTG